MLADRNNLNSTGVHLSERHSKIDISTILAGNYRFGELSPFEAFDTVPDDQSIRFNSRTNVRSLNLKAPLQQNVRMYKDYFHVPMSAILPMNWDKYEKMPNIGDDINPDTVGTNVKSFGSRCVDVIFALLEGFSTLPNNALKFTYFIKWVHFVSSVFSAGSLPSQLGTNFWPLLEITYKNQKYFFDQFIDIFFSEYLAYLQLNNLSFRVAFDNADFMVVMPSLAEDRDRDYVTTEQGRKVAISFRKFIELCRDNPHFTLSEASGVVTSAFSFDGLSSFDLFSVLQVDSLDYDLKYILAYQIVCAHFFSNDNVDYVYSAQLYRQNVYDALVNLSNYGVLSFEPPLSFNYNGQSYQYDFLSAFYIQSVLDSLTDGFSLDNLDVFLDYWNLIFNVRNSPRYVDYFTGSRTRPLAVADTTIPVTAEGVQVLDMTLPTAMARMAYFVGRVGRKAKRYMQEIFNVDIKPDYHEPWFLARTTDHIGSPETENTNVNPSDDSSTNSQTTISNFRSQSNQFAFETDSDVYGIIIGIMSFDINRLYGKGISHFNYHHDRYDMFNPLLQYTGDQKVYQTELDVRAPADLAYGYQTKYAEYKQAISRCFGAVALGTLPGFYFVASDRRDSDGQIKLSPSFIRSYPYEFDEFYISLSAVSPATYFHFVVDHENTFSAYRPMVAKPSLEIG